MKKFIVLLLGFLVGLVLFMPKDQLYFTALNLLQKERVEIKSKEVRDRWFWLDIKDAKIFYDGIESLEAKSIDMKPWLFYNSVVIEDAKSSQELRGVMEIEANKVILTHSLLNYKEVHIEAKGSFGEAEGSADLIDRSVKILLKPSKSFKNSQLSGYFKKSKEGWIYESKF